MAMVCPQCKESFDQRLQCPGCDARLVYQPSRAVPKASADEPGGKWMQTAAGRLLFGIILAQGLYFGLRKLCAAGLLAADDATMHGLLSTLIGVILVQAMQAIGLLVGGALAGAGYRRGTLLGIIVGLACGAVSLFFQPGLEQDTGAVMLYGQPLLQAAFGALGGFIGCTIWKPIGVRREPGKSKLIEKKPILPPMPASPPKFSGPIAWVRVLAGSALAVGGIFYAKTLLNIVLEASEGKLTVDTYLQAELVTWEIKALMMLVGSAVAGAGTVNSLKQGFCVGLCVAIVQAGTFLGTNAGTLEASILTVTAGMALSFVGGWFGGQLFPAYGRRVGRRKYGPAPA